MKEKKKKYMDNLITTKLPCFDETLYAYMFTRYMGPTSTCSPYPTLLPPRGLGMTLKLLGVPGVLCLGYLACPIPLRWPIYLLVLKEEREYTKGSHLI